MKTKRLISLVLVLVMMFQTVSFALTPDDFSDFPQEDYWSYDALESALDNGLLHGKGDGIIAPKDNLTRAEFAAVVTRAFGAKKIQNIDHVKDVTENDWFYKDNSISKAYKMGVMNGTALTTFSPNLDMRRQDVFLTLARALYVEATGNEAYIADMYDKVLGKFDDADVIDEYAKNALIGMVDYGYVNGYHNEDDDVWTLKPKDSITREELAQVFYNLFKYYISDYDITEENKGVFGGTNKNNIKNYDGSMIVRTPGVTLQYANIDGDLIIADGVGEGEFTLKGVHVEGNIIVRGGESKDDEVHRYITFTNVTSDGKVIVNNVNGTVHFNNYRTDKPFADGLIEHTKATFLERTGGGGGGGGVIGGAYTYSMQFFAQNLDDDEYALKKTMRISVPGGSTVKPFEVAVDKAGDELYGFELYPEGSPDYEAYNAGVKVKHNNLVFKVYFVRKSYNVEYADGVLDVSGNPFDDFSEKYETILDNLPTEVYPEDGKTFIGWSVEDDGTVDDEIKVLGDTTLYPVYTYEVTFIDPNGNPAGSPMTNVAHGYVITEQDIIDAGITDPEVEPGTKYVGWSLTPYVHGEPIETIDSLVGVEITGPVTYYQIVVDKDQVQYKVEHRLETVDGSGYVVDESIAATQVFWERPELTATATPLTNIEGFEYFEHPDEMLTGTVLEDGSLVLVVYYNRLTYDVTFKDINGNDEKTVDDVKYGATVDSSELPSDEDMKEPGKIFEGWTTTDGGDVDDIVDVETVVIGGETTFYPVYTDKEPAEYNVRHMFQSLDDENIYTPQFGYSDEAIPDFEVTATPLDESAVPEGFRYNPDHPDEVSSGIVLEDGSLVLSFYYDRLSYTVKFDGISEETYKYGYQLTEDDIPDDDEVTVPAGMQFMGWATEENQTTGTSKEDLVGTEVKEGITYYPAFAELGAVEYKIYHYFEALDGTYPEADRVEKKESAKPATTVTAEQLTGTDLPEGFEYFAHADQVLTGTVPSDGTTLELYVYYNRLTYTVEFDGISEETYKYGYQLTEDDIPDDDEVTVPAGMQFMGWATEENQTTGTSKEDLVGTEVTEGITYYPAFAELGAVEYKIYHYFEALDGTYPEADRVEKKESAKPATTVTAEQLTGTDLPEGFEYFAHADQVLTGTVPSDGTTLELYVYYNRLTYTVKFDTVSEETYKYGYELKLEDIPEDEAVTAPSGMEFKGWATTENQTSGVSREELEGTVVDGDLTYYPAFAEIGSVEYEIHYLFENLDSTYTEDETLRKTDNAKPGTTVTAVPLAEEDVPEGFELRDDTLPSDTIPSDGTTLVLEVYYSRKLIKVNFYDPAGDYYDSDTETYSQPNAVVEVRYGTKPDDAENLEKYIAAESDPESNYFTFDRGFEYGFVREKEYSDEYTNLTDEEREHKIPLYWWYENAETGEYEKFYDAEVPSEFTITEEMHVYAKAYKIEIRVMVEGEKYEGFFYTFYDEATRFLDTVKDLLYINARSITEAVEIAGVEDKGYEKFAEKGILVEVDGKYEIPNVNRLIRFSRLMGEEGFESFLAGFIDDSAVTSLEDFLFDYILTHDIDETAEHLKEMVDELVVGHEDIAHDMMHDLAVDIIEKEISHVEEFFKTYTTSLVEANDTDDLEKMICEMFTEYKKTNEAEFVAFVTEVVVRALSEDTPNADVVEMIEDYIKSEIKKGTYNDEIINYIMDMSDDDFKSAATAVIKEDVSIIETDVNDKILADNDFVETIIDEIFALDSETVDKKIKEYINDYNLADDYIKDNPEVIVDYITDEQIAEFYGGYIPGVALTKQEKVDAVTQFIEDDPDAVSKLKNYAGASNIKTVIGDYYDDNKATIKEEMKTEVVSNVSLRTDLADFAMSLIRNDEFSDLLDFAIDDYLVDVLADDTKKLNLAQQEVNRLNNDKVYNLDFVQEAIDTIIDDVLDDIKANETDGDSTTESEYIADIKNYVKSITNFADVVDSFVHADEEFRNDIIVNLFDDLYRIDSDHTIILQFMEKVTDKMIEEGDIDINILVTVIEYIRDMGDHGHKLTRDIISNLMKLDDELVAYVEENLGWIDNSGKLEASLKFKKEATYEEKFEVTLLNDEFIMDKVAEKVDSMTFDAFMDEFVYPRLPDNVSKDMVNKLPLDIFKNIYEKAHDDFTTSLEQARINVRNGMTDQWVYSGFFVSINPIVEVVEPVEAYAEKAYDAANEKAASYGGRVTEIYNAFYVDNPYIEDILSMYDIDNDTLENNFFEGTANPSDAQSSGFYIKSFEEIYNNVVLPTAILGDDMFVWYINQVDFEKIRSFAEDNEDLILAMYNHPNVLMARYAQEGLPETMEDYYHDLMEDPEIEDAFIKIDNKVSFEMEPFFMRFLTNSTIEMYYYKALEKFGMKADAILDKYDGAEVKKEITPENFADMLDEIEYCWKDGNVHATTNYVLDGGLKNLFSIVSIEKSLKGYTVSFERAFVDR